MRTLEVAGPRAHAKVDLTGCRAVGQQDLQGRGRRFEPVTAHGDAKAQVTLHFRVG
jgi:hypothetical protein